jgi:nitrite reductase/ring-hydroxylating ferredoxin subunit
MVVVKVAKKVDIPIGKMVHLEVDGKEIMIANVDEKFYALEDRCGHMNARLSMGTLANTVVTCPWHSSTFDVTTGKLISGPKPMQGSVADVFAKCPEEVQKTMMQMAQRMGEIQSVIKTYNRLVYEVKVDGNDLFINV